MLLLLLLSRVSRVRLCDPIDGSPPGSTVPGIGTDKTLPHKTKPRFDLKFSDSLNNPVNQLPNVLSWCLELKRADRQDYLTPLTSNNLKVYFASLVAQLVKSLPVMQKTGIQSLGQEDPLEKEMATHSSIPAWRIPWTEKPGGPQSMGSERVGHD